MKLKTVCGELSRNQLGTVTTHEHVLLDLTAFYQELPVKGSNQTISRPGTRSSKKAI